MADPTSGYSETRLMIFCQTGNFQEFPNFQLDLTSQLYSASSD